jgi:hypothetical protein
MITEINNQTKLSEHFTLGELTKTKVNFEEKLKMTCRNQYFCLLLQRNSKNINKYITVI